MYRLPYVITAIKSCLCKKVVKCLFIFQNPELLVEWEKGTGLKLYETYGQTETVSIDVDKK